MRDTQTTATKQPETSAIIQHIIAEESKRFSHSEHFKARSALQKVAALYLRLSRDDGGDYESNSISTQRNILKKYAQEHGFFVYGEYIDDGWSGTNFERPDFVRLKQDIEDGKIGVVICKDLSRLGRNNALVAYYTEIYFPDKNVRFIAASDAIDTLQGDNEIMPFKSVINEYYARDTSQKVRAAKRSSALNGKYGAAFAPYGYQKDPENKYRLIVDENTAENVRRMFQWAADGYSPFKIAAALSREGVLTPRAYTASLCGKYRDCFNTKYPTDWNPASVAAILRNREYAGHLIRGTATTKSFKNRELVRIAPEKWIIIPNTHEAIVSENLFELAQKVLRVKKPPVKSDESFVNLFAGLLRCADCGHGLTYAHQERPNGNYCCNTYRTKSARHDCTAHYIRYDVLYRGVSADIRRHVAFSERETAELAHYAQSFDRAAEAQELKRLKKDMDAAHRRQVELDAIIKKLFEQNALGVVSDERFAAMLTEYEAEQKDVSAELVKWQTALHRQEETKDGYHQFLCAVRKYVDVDALSVAMLNDLIEKIVVYEPHDKSRKNRKQRIDIYYKFIGKVECVV